MKEIEKLKKILKEENISIEKAARQIGVSFQTAFNWLNGKHRPSELALTQLRKFIKKHERYVPIDRR